MAKNQDVKADCLYKADSFNAAAGKVHLEEEEKRKTETITLNCRNFFPANVKKTYFLPHTS